MYKSFKNLSAALLCYLLLMAACAGSESLEEDIPEPTLRYPELPFQIAPPQLEDGTDFTDWRPKECPPGYMAEFGRDNCISIGDSCPSGLWPDTKACAQPIYVKPGGSGDGLTAATPLGSIQEAMNQSTSESTIVLSKGTFNESITILKAVSIVGSCAKETIIQSPTGDSQITPIVTVSSRDDVSIKNLTLTGSGPGIHANDSSGLLHLDGILITKTLFYAMELSNAHVKLSNSIIQDTTHTVSYADGAIRADSGTQLELYNVGIFNNVIHGVHIQDEGSNLIARKLTVQGTKVMNGSNGIGLFIIHGANATLNQIMLNENTHTGILTSNTDTTIEDMVVMNTLALPDMSHGRGFEANAGANIVMRRAYIGFNHENGIGLYDTNTRLEAYDVVVTNTQERKSDNTRGRGVHLSHGAHGYFYRALIDSNREVGVYLIHYENPNISRTVTFHADQIVIRKTKTAKCAESGVTPSCEYGFGDALVALGKTDVRLRNFEVYENQRVGLWFYDPTGTPYEYSNVLGLPQANLTQGSVKDNEYGINIRGESVTIADFTGVACYQNEKTVDGCYTDVELIVPDPL